MINREIPSRLLAAFRAGLLRRSDDTGYAFGGGAMDAVMLREAGLVGEGFVPVQRRAGAPNGYALPAAGSRLASTMKS